MSGDRDNVLARCLSLDLEVGRADERIHALAGVRPDTGQSLVIPRVGNNLAPALARTSLLRRLVEKDSGTTGLIANFERYLRTSSSSLLLTTSEMMLREIPSSVK